MILEFFFCRKLVDDQTCLQTRLHGLDFFGKLLKGHLLKYDQLKLKYYKLHESEIVINSALIIIIFYLEFTPSKVEQSLRYIRKEESKDENYIKKLIKDAIQL